MQKKIIIHVQHLLGAGHLVRAMTLAEALVDSGHKVQLISGGFAIDRAIEGYNFLQLPPTRAVAGDFTRLVDEQGEPITKRWRSNRAALLLDAVDTFKPDLVITETFPFGRRQFRFELEPLIHWVRDHNGVRLMASIRDVLQRRKHSRNLETVDTINKFYDCVLVHADKNLIRLDASFALCEKLNDKIKYTGYIHRPNVLPEIAAGSAGQNEIIISGGSGTVSARLLNIANQARSISSAKTRIWRVLSGATHAVQAIHKNQGFIVEANRPDFFSLLQRCALSVSQAGYNTTLDILASNAKSVMIPFVGDGETEQSDRAQALEKAGRILQLSESKLTPHNLAHTIDRALEMTVNKITVNLNGAASSAKFISQQLQLC